MIGKTQRQLPKLRLSYTFFICFLLVSVLTSCAIIGARQLNEKHGDSNTQNRWVEHQSPAGTFYEQAVKPILDKRCVSCHACYDPPCQLQLGAIEGIDRGISQSPVYSGTRLIAAEPTRLFIDKQSTAEWRKKGFSPVLNERQQSKDANNNQRSRRVRL